MKSIFAIIVIAYAGSVSAQGSFQNLNFEQANPMPIIGSQYYPYAVAAVSALPYWTVLLGNAPSDQVLYNDEFLGTATVDILSPPSGVIDGQYSAVLQSGGDLQSDSLVTASIAQSGTVPSTAQSLQFEAYDPSSLLSVSFGGNLLSPVVLGSGRSASGVPYNIYGINIVPYDRQYGQLEFTANLIGNVELDDISFSPEVVPEPGAVALTMIGGLLIGARKWLAWRWRAMARWRPGETRRATNMTSKRLNRCGG